MLDFMLVSTVLIIGDSHSVGSFGWELDESFRRAGLSVATYASCGSTARWWRTGKETTCGYYSKNLNSEEVRSPRHATPIFQNLLEEVKPDSVIVELGSNYVNVKNDESVILELQDMVSMIKTSGANCFWVTAPDMRLYRDELPRLNRLIQEAVGTQCRIFKSDEVTSYPVSGGDGVHYWSAAGAPIAKNWAKKVFESFMSGELNE